MKKLTFDYVKNFIEVESNSDCKLLSKEYKNTNTKLKIKCKCGEIFYVAFQQFKGVNKRQCNKCGAKIIGDRDRLSYNEAYNFIKDNGCELLSQEYKNSWTKLEIMCHCGNKYYTTYNAFNNGNQRQCRECGIELRAKQKRLDYEVVKKEINSSGCTLLSKKYSGNDKKLKIECECGNIFYTSYSEFTSMNKRQCNECGYNRRNEKSKTPFEEILEFIADSGYECMSEIYKNSHLPLKLKCPCGHIINMTWQSFQHGHRCKICAGNKLSEERRFPYEYVKQIIEDSGYTLISKEYVNSLGRLRLKCPNGHKISISLGNFQRGKRCPVCRESNGEQLVREILNKYNIDFESQYSFEDCIYKKSLPFDFCVFNQEKNIQLLIEYDGEGHYFPVRFNGMKEEKAIKNFQSTQKRDDIKTSYCTNNNIKLLRIPYWDVKNIEVILKRELSII